MNRYSFAATVAAVFLIGSIPYPSNFAIDGTGPRVSSTATQNAPSLITASNGDFAIEIAASEYEIKDVIVVEIRNAVGDLRLKVFAPKFAAVSCLELRPPDESTRLFFWQAKTAGLYLVEASDEAKDVFVKVTVGKIPPSDNDNDDGNDDGQPINPPAPKQKVGGVVIVEEKDDFTHAKAIQKSSTWANMKTFVKDAKWFDDDQPAAAPFATAARAAGLPAILLFDQSGNLIETRPLPQTEAELLELVK